MNTHTNNAITGSRKAFDENWKHREETLYNHWVKGAPSNQIQLAFLSHWQVFNEVYPDKFTSPGKVLEVGCGRGSISSHFAENGWDCTLLDYSQSVLGVAHKIFLKNGHNATFVNGDARSLPFEEEGYDVVVSIGLLEHFEDIETLIKEQYRILKKGGLFLGYVVPERPDNIQRHFNWLNWLIKSVYRFFNTKKDKAIKKEEVYRSDLYSPRYLEVINKLNVSSVKAFGMYPMPMISHSPEFPFSLMSPFIEKILSGIFKKVLLVRQFFFKKHGWICSEKIGQAFMVSFIKED